MYMALKWSAGEQFRTLSVVAAKSGDLIACKVVILCLGNSSELDQKFDEGCTSPYHSLPHLGEGTHKRHLSKYEVVQNQPLHRKFPTNIGCLSPKSGQPLSYWDRVYCRV
jgi:hypothetical protein